MFHQPMPWMEKSEWVDFRCVDPEESKKLMDEFHKRLCG
jgi:hypothetical protein